MDQKDIILEDAHILEAEELVTATIVGLRGNRKKRLPEKIICDGGYWMLGENGEKVSIFKPRGQAADREVAAYLLDHSRDGEMEGYGVGGVPITTMVQISDLKRKEAFTKGSLQEVIKNAPRLLNTQIEIDNLPVDQVQKISLIDIRHGNTSRTHYNILVKEAEGVSLIPIGHDTCFPNELNYYDFVWMNWPQSKVPYGEHMVKYVEDLDADADLELLEANGIHLGDEAEFVFKVQTLVLKAGVLGGYTPNELATFMMPQTSKLQLHLGNIVRKCKLVHYQAPNQDENQLLEKISNEIKTALSDVRMFIQG